MTKRPRVRIEDDPPVRTTCFLHDCPLEAGKCPRCESVRKADTRAEAEYPCPKCQTPAKARRLLKKLAAVCPKCSHPFSP